MQDTVSKQVFVCNSVIHVHTCIVDLLFYDSLDQLWSGLMNSLITFICKQFCELVIPKTSSALNQIFEIS